MFTTGPSLAGASCRTSQPADARHPRRRSAGSRSGKHLRILSCCNDEWQARRRCIISMRRQIGFFRRYEPRNDRQRRGGHASDYGRRHIPVAGRSPNPAKPLDRSAQLVRVHPRLALGGIEVLVAEQLLWIWRRFAPARRSSEAKRRPSARGCIRGDARTGRRLRGPADALPRCHGSHSHRDGWW